MTLNQQMYYALIAVNVIDTILGVGFWMLLFVAFGLI